MIQDLESDVKSSKHRVNRNVPHAINLQWIIANSYLRAGMQMLFDQCIKIRSDIE